MADTDRELLRDVVTDYTDKCCDHPGTCDCSMGRAFRHLNQRLQLDCGCRVELPQDTQRSWGPGDEAECATHGIVEVADVIAW